MAVIMGDQDHHVEMHSKPDSVNEYKVRFDGRLYDGYLVNLRLDAGVGEVTQLNLTLHLGAVDEPEERTGRPRRLIDA